ncbi:MAG: hypothetical protein ACREBG_13900 [Pyrinomonadaceae bacterium]
MVSLKLSQLASFGPAQVDDAVGVMKVGPFHVTGLPSDTFPEDGLAVSAV